MGAELEKSKVVPFVPVEMARGPERVRLRPESGKPPSAKNCKPYVRKRLAKALPEIANALIEKAREGSLPELKMLVQMSGLDEKNASGSVEKRRGKSLEQMLMEDWRKEPLDGADQPYKPIV